MATFARPRAVTIAIDDARRVSGLLQAPKNPRACYVLAHGAGAGMSHPFMAAVVDGLAERGIAILRYQFQGSKRPDAPKLAQATVRAAVAQASPSSEACPGRRRQIVWRPHDIAGTGRSPAA